MRIGIFTNAYEPILNGVVNSIKGFKQGLEHEGHQVYILAPRYPGHHDDSDEIFRFASVSVNKAIDFPLAVPGSVSLIRTIKDLDLDIIHAHHPFLLGSLGKNLGRRWDIPVTATIHTQYEQYSHYIPLNKAAVSMATRAMVRRFCASVDMVLTPSESMRQYLIANGISDKVEVVPNAVDVDKFKTQNDDQTALIRNRLGLSNDDFVIGNVGRMAQEKNIDFLLDMVDRIKDRLPNVRLLLVGGGPQLERLSAKAAFMGLGDRVIFTGPVQYEEVPAYISAIDLFVMASVTEVQPLSLIESMASGTPVLGVRAFGSQDIISDGIDGFLVDLDYDHYRDKIELLAGDRDLLCSFGQSAGKSAEQYSLANATRKLLDCYNRLVGYKDLPIALTTKTDSNERIWQGKP